MRLRRLLSLLSHIGLIVVLTGASQVHTQQPVQAANDGAGLQSISLQALEGGAVLDANALKTLP